MVTCVGHPDKGRSCRAKEENPDEIEDHMTGRRGLVPATRAMAPLRPGEGTEVRTGGARHRDGLHHSKQRFLAARDIASALSDVVRCPLEGPLEDWRQRLTGRQGEPGLKNLMPSLKAIHNELSFSLWKRNGSHEVHQNGLFFTR